jgi:hypothetical protein
VIPGPWLWFLAFLYLAVGQFSGWVLRFRPYHPVFGPFLALASLGCTGVGCVFLYFAIETTVR